MGHKNGKRKDSKSAQPQIPVTQFSKEEYIEIQAEAYYRAMKRIHEEKAPVISEKTLDNKEGKLYKIGLALRLLLLPVIPKKIKVNRAELLKTLHGGPLYFTGFVIYCIGIAGLIMFVAELFMKKMSFESTILLLCMTILALFLSVYFRLAAKDIESETDINKLYAYTGSLAASISLLLSIIALIKK